MKRCYICGGRLWPWTKKVPMQLPEETQLKKSLFDYYESYPLLRLYPSVNWLHLEHTRCLYQSMSYGCMVENLPFLKQVKWKSWE